MQFFPESYVWDFSPHGGWRRHVIITSIDTRTLGVVIMQPVFGTFWNIATQVLETPFVAANHLHTFTQTPGQSGALTACKYCDLGLSADNRSDLVAVLCTLDGTGAITDVIDQWAANSPATWPVIGVVFRQ